MGGLARRATQVERARAESDATLVVDAGDLFLPAPAAPGERAPDPSEAERRARLVAQALGQMGTAAIAPGERDLALGLPLLRRIAADAHLALLSANLRDRAGNLLFAPDRIVEAAGTKIGIFGVTAPPTPADAAAFAAAGIEVGDPTTTAMAQAVALRGRGARIVIALLHVGAPADNRRLLGAISGINWAVAGHSGLRLETPETVGQAQLLGVLAEGKELGRLDLHVVERSLAFVDRGQRVEIESILADHRRQLVDYDRRLGETDPATLRDYYETRHRELEKAIAREAALLERLPRAIEGSWFENRLIPLDAETSDQTDVAALVSAYKRERERRGRRR
jgi:2',3'-cyclic-nucleotide 2'-phosphodiesterase (5'-nucleotidase family)